MKRWRLLEKRKNKSGKFKVKVDDPVLNKLFKEWLLQPKIYFP